jgi:AcrR family transcriptional regulator
MLHAQLFRSMPKLSSARAAARRQQIIDAAIICFAERGFHKATLQDVVRASGLSPGSIYCHFTNKDEIVHAVIRERHRRDLRSLEDASHSKTLDDALALLADAFFLGSNRREDRAWRRLAVQLWAESLHDRKLSAAVRDGVDKPRTVLADLLRNARDRGELPVALDPEATARVLIAAFQGVVLQRVWNESVDVEACVRVMRMLLSSR